jgi:hypothetical protein
MQHKHRNVMAIYTVCVLSLLVLGSLPIEIFAAGPIGSIIARNNATIGNRTAPSGAAIFEGDRIAAIGKESSAMVRLNSGSQIEFFQGSATFSRQGKMLVVHVNPGLYRFCFQKGEEVAIVADNYRFTSLDSGTARIGELGINSEGRVAMTLNEGRFSVFDAKTGETFQVAVNTPLFKESGQTIGSKATSKNAVSHAQKAIKAGGIGHVQAGASHVGLWTGIAAGASCAVEPITWAATKDGKSP